VNSYTTLKSSIANWFAKSNVTSSDSIVDDCIDLAEAEVNRRLRLRFMVSTATATVTAGDTTVALPDDFLELRGAYRDGSPQSSLEYCTPEQLNSISNSSRAPYAFSIIGSNLAFPGPDSDGSEIELTYYAKPTALSASNETNWLTTNAPQVYLFGALKYAAIYAGDDADAQRYGTLFEGALSALTTEEAFSAYGPAPHMRSEGYKW